VVCKIAKIAFGKYVYSTGAYLSFLVLIKYLTLIVPVYEGMSARLAVITTTATHM
jgi:hypothetical protein